MDDAEEKVTVFRAAAIQSLFFFFFLEGGFGGVSEASVASSLLHHTYRFFLFSFFPFFYPTLERHRAFRGDSIPGWRASDWEPNLVRPDDPPSTLPLDSEPNALARLYVHPIILRRARGGKGMISIISTAGPGDRRSGADVTGVGAMRAAAKRQERASGGALKDEEGE